MIVLGVVLGHLANRVCLANLVDSGYSGDINMTLDFVLFFIWSVG